MTFLTCSLLDLLSVFSASGFGFSMGGGTRFAFSTFSRNSAASFSWMYFSLQIWISEFSTIFLLEKYPLRMDCDKIEERKLKKKWCRSKNQPINGVPDSGNDVLPRQVLICLIGRQEEDGRKAHRHDEHHPHTHHVSGKKVFQEDNISKMCILWTFIGQWYLSWKFETLVYFY